MDNINLNNIKGKKVLVVGMGRSGIAALQAMLKLGADVTVQDAKKADEMDGRLLSFLTGKGLKLCLGSVPDDICDFDMMILSPGVDPELDFICRAREAGGGDNRRTGDRLQDMPRPVRCDHRDQRQDDYHSPDRRDI